jgi:hypothetical protein
MENLNDKFYSDHRDYNFHFNQNEYGAEHNPQSRTMEGLLQESNRSNHSMSSINSAGGNAESEQMKVFVSNANVSYNTRHARRIYVGGIPPNYSDEEELRNFFNRVISKGLEIENDNSFVISVYMNQKKCYAFVEFNSVELTSACLEMDGIIFKKVTLKIYRANEYRADLAPVSKFIHLDLSSWAFGVPTGVNAGNPSMNHPSSAYSHRLPGSSAMGSAGRPTVGPVFGHGHGHGHGHGGGSGPGAVGMGGIGIGMGAGAAGSLGSSHGMHHAAANSNVSWGPDDFRCNTAPPCDGAVAAGAALLAPTESLASIIQFTTINDIEPGSLVIVGFPFVDVPRFGNVGASPTSIRSSSTSFYSTSTSANSNSKALLPKGLIGAAASPSCLRRCLSSFPCGAVFNAELGIDCAQLRLADVGDVLAGQTPGETKALLATTVTELLQRGSVPFLLGGGRDQTFHSAMVRKTSYCSLLLK